jgi:hypothetical protein
MATTVDITLVHKNEVVVSRNIFKIMEPLRSSFTIEWGGRAKCWNPLAHSRAGESHVDLELSSCTWLLVANSIDELETHTRSALQRAPG